MICTASVQESVPRWLVGKGRGWLTAEYGMLPASTGERKQRDVAKGRPDGRTVEIQRLIGRSLRGIADLERARRAHDLRRLRRARGRRRHALRVDHRRLRRARAGVPPPAKQEGLLAKSPLTGTIAAVSCGVVDGTPLLDLDYPEDSNAEVDANVVMTGDGGLVEVQATAERTPLSRAHLDELLALAQTGIEGLRAAQEAALRDVAVRLLLATRNDHKLREFERLLPGIEIEPLPDEAPTPEETGDTYAENALIKARSAAQATSRPAFADDSGIEAEALGWRPGVRTARFAGPDATDEREPRQAQRRGARRQPRPLRLRDRPRHAGRRGAPLRGHAARARSRRRPRGEKGFGYDPLFIADETPGRTMAELDDDEKDAISHRGARRPGAARMAHALSATTTATTCAPAAAPPRSRSCPTRS